MKIPKPDSIDIMIKSHETKMTNEMSNEVLHYFNLAPEQLYSVRVIREILILI